MEAHELMIGNYITQYLGMDDDGSHYKEQQITGIKYEYSDIHIRLDQTDTWHHNGNFEPIPLTEDWLIKLGFKNTDTGFEMKMWRGHTMSLIIVRNKYAIVACSGPFGLTHSAHLNYIHQLQNIFYCLTGEQLTIKN